MTRFSEFVKRFPAYRNVPFQVEREQILSLSQIERLPVWTDKELWTLAEEYYNRLSKTYPEVRILTASGLQLSFKEAVSHLKRRTDIGKWLVDEHYRFLEFIKRRMREEGYA